MEKLNRGLMIIFSILFLNCFGCSKSDLTQAKIELQGARKRIQAIESALKEANEKLGSAKSEHLKLSNDIVKLKTDVNTLMIENKTLKEKYEELHTWSKQLVAGYGPGIWYIHETTRPIFVKSMKSSDVKGIVQELNGRFERDHLPKIILKKISDKKAYVGVSDQDLLTQRMGSHGAASYIDSVTYSITSMKDIHCVWFDFVAGDHAVPGEYCR